ncbi:MAG: Hsp20/alpha crystallin family protein [Candidatus Omnitrophica bacterium]|nr:Hsp20/alpha crystallin family protein [Candidatus Omnitrophota bacterium]
MKKILGLIGLFYFSVFMSFALAVSDSERDAATAQARQDYRAYLDQLRELRKQYQGVIGEVRKIVREEGLPTWGEEGEEEGRMPYAPTMAATDIEETDKEIIVKMDLPGIRKDNINVTVENNEVLRISGSRETEKEEKKETQDSRYHRHERQYGGFERTIKLPASVRDDATQAKYENGVLTIRVPKAPESKKKVVVPVK